MYNLQFKNATQVDPVYKAPIAVPIGTVDTSSTDLVLTGKGAANYGTHQQQNLMLLLENFADVVQPRNPTVGQLWYDSVSKMLKVLTDKGTNTWKSIGGLQVTGLNSPPPLTPVLGDLWFQKTGQASGFLYMYTGIGRYPTTGTTIGGWEQVTPSVQALGSRDEYDQVLKSVLQLIGPSVSMLGSDAFRRSKLNLTDFGALDNDLRAKFKALPPQDANVLYSPLNGVSMDREISAQAVSNTLFYFSDTIGGSDGYIGGLTAGVPDPNAPGTIFINGLETTVPAGQLWHSGKIDDALVVFFQSGLPTSYAVCRELPGGQWQYDTNTAWVDFTPDTGTFAIGTVSTYQEDTNEYPIDKAAFLWHTAVPLLGTKYEHLKVQPNSNDWDALLAAAKYAIDRLEVPAGYAKLVSDLPFVYDGRQVPQFLKGLNSAGDVRYPSAARRSNQPMSTISSVQRYSETINVLNSAIANRFSIRGINGATGTNPAFGVGVVLENHCSPAEASTLASVVSSGTGSVRILLRFDSIASKTSFLGSGGALQVQLTHQGGGTPGDNLFRLMIDSIGVYRITADKTRVFGEPLPLTMSRPTVSRGMWNAETAGTVLTQQAYGTANITVSMIRSSNTTLTLDVSFNVGGALSGTTAVSVGMIYDGATSDTVPVFSKPEPFSPSDVVKPL